MTRLACAWLPIACLVLACGSESTSRPRGSAGQAGEAGAAATGGSAGTFASGSGAIGGAGGSQAGGSGGSGGTASGGSGGASGSGGGGAAGVGGGTSYGIVPQAASVQHALAAYQMFRDQFFVPCGSATRVASGIGSEETFSEGMGYGMLMVAYLEPDASGPALLSSLLEFVSSKIDGNGLMHWKVSCDDVWNENAATDGDLDYTLALIQGEKRWPGQGFGDAARRFIDAILAHETDGCGLKPGDAWGGCNAEANPSYAALGYLDVFQCFTGNGAWAAVRQNTMQRQLAYWFDHYALPPDWVRVDSGGESGRHSRGTYGYDATRVPWRMAVDYLWHGKLDSQAQVNKLVTRMSKSDPDPSTIGDGYDHQSGNKLSNNHNGAFVGPLAVGAMVDAQHQSWLDAAYTDLLGLHQSRYYQDALRVLSLMVLSGRFTPPCP